MYFIERLILIIVCLVNGNLLFIQHICQVNWFTTMFFYLKHSTILLML